MESRFDRLNLFFDKIKNISLWQRIFGWQGMRSLSYDAYREFRSLLDVLNSVSVELDTSKHSLDVLKNDYEHLNADQATLKNELKSGKEEYDKHNAEIQNLKSENAAFKEAVRNSDVRITQQNQENASLKEKLEQLSQEHVMAEKENAIFRQTEEGRKTKYESDVAALNAIRQEIVNDRKAEQEDKQRKEIEILQSMKDTWAKHQENVKETIKVICQKHTIDYAETVPFKGNPDNAIRICDEFVIFDAKSPATDDLTNFPTYIKNQTESVKKYAKEENVKKDIFLVIPSNTVDVIEQFAFNLADYNVYVVTIDALEPVILSLKKIEEYEFLEQLSPDERENVCRLIGKFAHMTKRRIQIDQFFEWQFLEILTRCKTDLPREILEKVIEFEKSEKLNPPQEKRAKQILTKDLESESKKIQSEAVAKGIVFPMSIREDIKQLPLYADENVEEHPDSGDSDLL